MRILLTNDDGFKAPGLRILAGRLRKEHEVWVVAPAANRSGASMCLSLNRPQLLESYGDNEFSLDGSPADCVYSALGGSYLPGRPDIVISGINNGGNLGTDIAYSGTCGAARQAALSGIPSIALSVEFAASSSWENPVFDFEPLADFAAKNITRLVSLCGKPDEKSGRYEHFVNVNAPSGVSYRGVRFAGLSKRIYSGDSVNIERKNDEKVYSTCVGGKTVSAIGAPDSDALLMESGYVSVSVLYTEPRADESFCKEGTGDFIL